MYFKTNKELTFNAKKSKYNSKITKNVFLQKNFKIVNCIK